MFLLLGCITLFVVGSVMYVNAEIPYFSAPDVSGNLVAVIAMLNSNYSQASTHIAQYQDFWVLRALAVMNINECSSRWLKQRH